MMPTLAPCSFLSLSLIRRSSLETSKVLRSSCYADLVAPTEWDNSGFLFLLLPPPSSALDIRCLERRREAVDTVGLLEWVPHTHLVVKPK